MDIYSYIDFGNHSFVRMHKYCMCSVYGVVGLVGSLEQMRVMQGSAPVLIGSDLERTRNGGFPISRKCHFCLQPGHVAWMMKIKVRFYVNSDKLAENTTQ